MSLLPSQSDFDRHDYLLKSEVQKRTIQINEKSLRNQVINFIDSPNCQEWHIALVIWIFRYIKRVTDEKKKNALSKYLKAALNLIEQKQNPNKQSIFGYDTNDHNEQEISSLLLNCLKQIKKEDSYVQPSIENCLTKDEKAEIEYKLENIQNENREISIELLDKSPQIKVLKKYEHFSGFSKYMYQLNYLKDNYFEDPKNNKVSKASLLYLLKEDDYLPDNSDLIGLLDDLYAVSYTYKKLNPNKEFYDLVNIHDDKYPAFSFPGVGENDLLPLTNLEDLVKACYINIDQNEPLKRFVVTREIGPLGLLVAIGKSLTDRFDATAGKNKIVSFIKGDIINIGLKTISGNKKRKINARYERKYGSEHFISGKNKQEIKTSEESLKNATKISGDSNVSSYKEIESFLDPKSTNYERYLWDELLFSKNIKKMESSGKILLVSEKASLESFLNQKMYGETIRSWFGIKGFKRDYKLEEEIPSPQQLFPEAQIILATKDEHVYKALDLHKKEEDHFNISLIICAKSSILTDDTLRSRIYEAPIDTVIFNEVYKNGISKSLEASNFKPLIGIQDEYQPIDIEKGGAFGSYLIRSLKPNIIVKEMKDDKHLKHLDKLRSFLKEFNDENIILKYRFARIAHNLGQKLIPFSEEERKNFEDTLDLFLEDLEVQSRFINNLKEVYSYLKEHKKEIIDISRHSHIESYLNEDKRLKHSLICRQSHKEKLKKFFKNKDFNLDIINKSELDEKGFFKNLIIPYFWGAEISTKLRNYHYAQNHIFFLTKEEYKLHKKMEKREKRFFEKENNLEEDKISFEISKELDERMENLDPLFSLLEDTAKIVELNKGGEVKENIPSNLFVLEGDKIYLSPKDGDCLSISRELNKITYGKSSEISPGDKLVIAEGISGDDLLNARMENDIKKFNYYKNLLKQAKVWQQSLKEYKLRENLDLKELREKLQNFGVKRTEATIKGWLNDPDTLQPQNKGDIAKIFALTNESNEIKKKCSPSIDKVRELRDIAKEELTKILEDTEVEENSKHINVSLGTQDFNFSIHSIEATKKVEVGRNHLYKIESIDDLLVNEKNG
ncbi:MAG: hypothetical protein CMD29_05825 [Flavobacteriales bacterium]|nr:hypothetical protein [Flavobacteriales bacterium]|tara:strand:+ start:1234 stop:4449 length:3216 start_codon:yes stop_codon:yes gene_type:complete